MAHKRKIDYFEMFVKISAFSVEYVNQLVAFLEGYYDEEAKVGHIDPHEALIKLQELHAIEDASDEVTHEVISNLVNEFVTPIDREDILQLAQELDDVVDDLDEVLQHMYMHCVTTITPELIDMVHIVQKATDALHVACEKFVYFKKSHSIHDYVVRVHDFEDEGDLVYIRAVHEVYEKAKESSDPTDIVEAHGLADVLAALERCCDSCEAVSNTIVSVITKNS